MSGHFSQVVNSQPRVYVSKNCFLINIKPSLVLLGLIEYCSVIDAVHLQLYLDNVYETNGMTRAYFVIYTDEGCRL